MLLLIEYPSDGSKDKWESVRVAQVEFATREKSVSFGFRYCADLGPTTSRQLCSTTSALNQEISSENVGRSIY